MSAFSWTVSDWANKSEQRFDSLEGALQYIRAKGDAVVPVRYIVEGNRDPQFIDWEKRKRDWVNGVSSCVAGNSPCREQHRGPGCFFSEKKT